MFSFGSFEPFTPKPAGFVTAAGILASFTVGSAKILSSGSSDEPIIVGGFSSTSDVPASGWGCAESAPDMGEINFPSLGSIKGSASPKKEGISSAASLLKEERERKEADFLASAKERSLQGRLNAQKLQAAAAQAKAEILETKQICFESSLPNWVKVQPKGTSLEAQVASKWGSKFAANVTAGGRSALLHALDYGPISGATSCISEAVIAQMEGAYEAHIGNARARVKQAQQRQKRAYHQRVIKRAAKAAQLAASRKEDRALTEAQIVAAEASQAWEALFEKALQVWGVVEVGNLFLTQSTEDIQKLLDIELAVQATAQKWAVSLSAESSEEESVVAFSEAIIDSSNEESFLDGIDTCPKCAVPTYMGKYFGNQWVASCPGCPWVWGVTHFSGEEEASAFLFELLQAKTCMGVHCWELTSQFSSLSLSTMQMISLYWETFQAALLADKEKFALLQKARRATRARVFRVCRASLPNKRRVRCTPLGYKPVSHCFKNKESTLAADKDLLVGVGDGLSLMTPLSWLMDACKMSWASNIYQRVVDDITKCLESFLGKLKGLSQMFWDSVNWIQESLKKMLNEHWFAALVGISLVSSFVFFLAIILCVKLFCTLVGSLGFSGATLLAFLSLIGGVFLGCIGLRHCIGLEWDQLCERLVNLFFSRVDGSSSEDASAEEHMKGDAIMIDFCTSIFETFTWLVKCILPAETIRRQGCFVGFGQLGNGIKGCLSLKDHFWVFGSRVLDYCSGVWDSLTNQSIGKIKALNELLKTDFVQWCNDIDKYCNDTYESLVINKLARLYKVRELEDKMKLFEPVFLDPINKMPTIASNMYWKACELLKNFLLVQSKCKFLDKPRCTPFSIWLYGPGRVGKSVAYEHIISDLADRLGMPKVERFYIRKTNTEYWDAYNHQLCTVYDDFNCFPGQDEEWFQLITPAPVPVHMAAIGEKGRIFTSEFVFCTSNLLSFREDTEAADREAYDGKRHVLLEARRNPDYKPGDSNRTFTQYALRAPCSPGYPYRSKCGLPCEEPDWMTHAELLDILYDAYSEHREKQHVARGNCNMDNDALGCRDFFFLCKNLCLKDLLSGTEFCQEDLDTLFNSFEAYDRGTGFKFVNSLSLMDNVKMNSLMNHIDQNFDDNDLMDCLSILPLATRGKLFAALVENDDYPFLCNYLFTPFEKYLFSRLKKMKPLADIKRAGFLNFISSFKEKIVGLYKDIMAKCPPFLKFILSIAFFFMFGYGVFVSCKKLCVLGASLAGLTAVISGQGDGIVPSQDNKTRKQSQKRDVLYTQRQPEKRDYLSHSIGAGAGMSWADYADLYGDTQPIDYTLAPEVLESVNTNFDFVKPYIVSLVDITDPKNPKQAQGFNLGGRCVAMVEHTWKYQIQGGLFHYSCGDVKMVFRLFKTRLRTFKVPGFDMIVVQLPAVIPLSDSKGFNLLPKTRGDVPRNGPYYAFSQESSISAGTDVHRKFFYVPVIEPGCKPLASYDVGHEKYICSPGIGYKGHFGAGDCGVVLFTPTKVGQPPLVCVMHDASTRKKLSEGEYQNCHGQYFSQEDLAGYEVLLDAQARGDCLTGEEVLDGLNEQNVSAICRISKEERPHYSRKSQLEPSLISKIVEVPNTTTPAIIFNDDERIATSNNPSFDVFRDGMSKYKKMALPFEGETEEEQQDFHDALADIFVDLDIPDGSLEEVDEEVALRGIAGVEYFDPIVPSTSEGYPWILHRPFGCSGKSWLLEGAPGSFSVDHESPFGKALDNLEMSLQAGILPPLYGVECPKDERVPFRKIENPKTRLFTVLPFEYNLLVRKYFLQFVAKYMSAHNKAAGKVGINVHSLEWTILHDHLAQKGRNWFNGDFERFDGITPRDVVQGIVQHINKKYVKVAKCNKVRSLLMMASSDRFALAGSIMYKVTGGIPSGFPLTVIVNSLVNEFFLRFSFKRLVRNNLRTEASVVALAEERFKYLRDFSKEDEELLRSRAFTIVTQPMVSKKLMDSNVAIAVYGDDNLVSVKEAYSSIYNLRTISFFLKEYGVVLKNGQDKTQEDFAAFSPPERCDFLKRRMVLSDGGRVLCPLGVDSLYGELHWVRKSNDPGKAIFDNAQGALREAYYHGRAFFFDLRAKILYAFQKSGLPTHELFTWEQVEGAWLCDSSKLLHFHPVNEDTRIFIESSSFFEKIAPQVYLAGVNCKTSLFPANSQVIWCGATNLFKPFISHRLISFNRSGYVTSNVIRQLLKKLDYNRPIIFMSADGLSQAIPPTLLCLRRIHGSGSNYERVILEKTTDSGKVNPYWLDIISGNETLTLNLVTSNEIKFNDFKAIVSQIQGFDLERVSMDLEELDNQPSCSKVMEGKLADACLKHARFPLLVEDSGLYTKTGRPGAMIKHWLKEKPFFWKAHCGEQVRIVSCTGVKCHPKCPSHIVEKTVVATVCQPDQYRDDLYGWEKFCLFDGKFSDKFCRTSEVLCARGKALRSVLSQTCAMGSF
nr:polyprotein [Cassava-Congo cheravirus]WGC96598.1 polyprotein [Cassava-Congo cheravirus]